MRHYFIMNTEKSALQTAEKRQLNAGETVQCFADYIQKNNYQHFVRSIQSIVTIYYDSDSKIFHAKPGYK